MNHVEILVLALLIDAAIGEPKVIWDRIPHPAVLMGRAIDWLEARLNIEGMQKSGGILAVLILVAGSAVLGMLIAVLPDWGLLELLGASILIAYRSLIDHVRAVALALPESLSSARFAVGRIVGRDPEQLDESGVARAAIESAAENFSDGVVAPIFWFLLFGLPGLLVYKIVNTADSMIGNLTPRYAAFGWAAARLDDVLNWIPARLTGALIVTATISQEAMDTMRSDADLHASPNAGWPEAAMAGALKIGLGGPRSYEGKMTRDPWLNPTGRRNVGVPDINAALTILWRAWGILVVFFAALALIF